MKTRHTTKKFWEMTGSELREATKEFDKEFVADTFHAPNAAGRQRQKRARRGRPKIGEGCVPLLVSMEQNVLRDLDGYARRHKTSRSRAISEAVRLLMASRKAS